MGLPSPATDAEPARWAAQLLTQGDYARGDRASVLVSSLIPPIYEAYCRIFHPQERSDEQGERYMLKWKEAADRHGRVFHAEALWSGIVQGDHRDAERADWPMPIEWIERLTAILSGHTGTPERCWFAIWPGYSPMDTLARTRTRSTFDQPTMAERGGPSEAVAEFQWPRTNGARLLFRGSVQDLPDACLGFGLPESVWPQDRSWFCGADLYANSTYIGGTRACIDEILADPEMEALEIGADAHLMLDTLNG